jgi:citrate synthase
MKIGPDSSRSTSISTSNPEQIVIRGYDLCDELIGTISLTDHLWLLVTGNLPSPEQRRALDAALVAIAEHGLVPSVQTARSTYAAAPEAFQGAIAAGLLGCGSVILGAAENAARLLTEVASGDGSIEDNAHTVISAMRAARQPIPGYGHPFHKSGDPRTNKLIAIAKETGLLGKYVAAAQAIESVIPEITGKTLVLNVSGAIPALLLDAGFPMLAMKGVPLLARTASLIAHVLEERTNPIGFALTEAGANAISYHGKLPASGPLSLAAAE